MELNELPVVSSIYPGQKILVREDLFIKKKSGGHKFVGNRISVYEVESMATHHPYVNVKVLYSMGLNPEPVGKVLQKNGLSLGYARQFPENPNEGIKTEYKAGGHVEGVDANGQKIKLDTAKHGGMGVGATHEQGGIQGKVGSDGHPIEFETGEAIITAPALQDSTKREFEGEMLTNREILSRINQSGGGVAFEEGGEVSYRNCACSGKRFQFGGRILQDYVIALSMDDAMAEKLARGAAKEQNEHSETINAYHSGSISFKDVFLEIAAVHLLENPNYYDNE